MSVFGENDSRRLSNFLQTHIFWKFDHISRTYNQINYRNIWFAKVIIILIMTAQVLFSILFFEKEIHLNTVECPHGIREFQHVYLYHSSLHRIIFIYWKLPLVFSESVLCGNHRLHDLSMLWCQNTILWKTCWAKRLSGNVMIGCGCTNLSIWYSNTC